ncbi:MAG: copper resistance D family protein [Methylocystis sp.]|uniref:copper resistance D family protein n=1 Tax=Methylocystis sp. TaxID=1911079 RepID=UPI003DA42C4F
MQSFLAIYGLIEWFLRGLSMAAQAAAVGGVAYFVFTIRPFRPAERGQGSSFERLCMRLLFWSASVLCVAKLLSALALIAYLVGSAGVDVETAASADAVTFDVISACAGFALACLARAPAFSAPLLQVTLSWIIVGAHAGVTHAASRVAASPMLLGAETLHLYALAAWIGGLPYFIASLRMLRESDARALLALRFSFTSLVSVAVIVATGVFMALPYVGTLDGLYQTNYGLLLSTKLVLLLFLICLGAANFLAIRKLRRKGSAMPQHVPVLAEAEVGIGIITVLCAVALASSPLSAESRAARPETTEISKRFELAWPRLEAPAFAQLSAAQAPESAAGATAVERTPFDIAWSEALHHYAALVVVAMGLAALAAQTRRVKPLTRHWPLLFLGLAAYLFVVADEDAWPLGKIGFFESLAVPRIAQHKLMIAMVAGFALFEWRARLNKTKAAWPSYMFPLTIAAAAAFLLTHYGHTGDKNEVLIEISHTPVALLGVIAATARWLEIRLPASAISRVAAMVWPLAFTAAGAFLLLYRETA